MATDKDRITLAWELRRDIHAWLVANPFAVMAEIFEAFAHRNRETVRKAVLRMRADGDVAMVGRNKLNNEGIYSATSAAVKSPESVRKRLAAGADKGRETLAARRAVLKAARIAAALDGKAANECRRKAESAARQESESDKLPKKPEWVGGSIKHIGGSLPPVANQRGQGAARQPVTVNCFITW